LADDIRLFFVTDIHASEVCFRKFLNAANFYGCDVLIMGGDMTGKMLVPIIARGGGKFSTRLFGRERTVGEAELPALRKLVADAGYYGYDTTPDEITALEQDRRGVDLLFQKAITDMVDRWLDLAQTRLRDSAAICIMGPGNDDPDFVDEALRQSSRVINPEGRVVELPGGFQMISVGYSNPTPWDSPRELPEDQLLERIEGEVRKLPASDKVIFNLHVPPKNTKLDQAALLDEELRPVLKGGLPIITGVGSTAVRTAIERHQPMLTLHGHIHESRAMVKLGRTQAINPGSEYSEGVLRGTIITLSPTQGVRGYQMVAG
jgi:Icc-related predicted phosphoesterase